MITSAFSYQAEEIWPLLHSIQEHAPNTDTLVFSSKEDIQRLTPQLKNAENISFRAIEHPPTVIKGALARPRKAYSHARKWIKRVQHRNNATNSIAIEKLSRRAMSTIDAHFLIRRFFWARQLLESQESAIYSNVLLCDIRDVVLQANPFDDPKDGLITGEEFNTISRCAMNQGWIQAAYGADISAQMHPFPILCAGVTLASRNTMEAYLSTFCEEALRMMQRLRTSCVANLDQAIHNKLLRLGNTIKLTASSFAGPVATLGCVPSDMIAIAESGEIQINGKTPSIVHQYDRHPNLTAHISQLYGL